MLSYVDDPTGERAYRYAIRSSYGTYAACPHAKLITAPMEVLDNLNAAPETNRPGSPSQKPIETIFTVKPYLFEFILFNLNTCQQFSWDGSFCYAQTTLPYHIGGEDTFFQKEVKDVRATLDSLGLERRTKNSTTYDRAHITRANTLKESVKSIDCRIEASSPFRTQTILQSENSGGSGTVRFGPSNKLSFPDTINNSHEFGGEMEMRMPMGDRRVKLKYKKGRSEEAVSRRNTAEFTKKFAESMILGKDQLKSVKRKEKKNSMDNSESRIIEEEEDGDDQEDKGIEQDLSAEWMIMCKDLTIGNKVIGKGFFGEVRKGDCLFLAVSTMTKDFHCIGMLTKTNSKENGEELQWP